MTAQSGMLSHCPDRARLEAEVEARGPWFHNLHLPGGVQTAPGHRFGDFPAFKWRGIAPHLPTDLRGWRALDIGCNAGFYSFALADRGADVLGIDSDEHYLAQARWAAEVTGRQVRFENRSVYEVAALGSFDLVLFMGVFYHLRHPLLALDLVASLAPRLMVFQSLTLDGEAVAADATAPLDFDRRHRLSDPAWPRMAFIEGWFADDPTNWWVPNHAGILGMLRSAGFEPVVRPGHEIYVCHPAAGGSPRPDPSATDAAAALVRGGPPGGKERP